MEIKYITDAGVIQSLDIRVVNIDKNCFSVVNEPYANILKLKEFLIM